MILSHLLHWTPKNGVFLKASLKGHLICAIGNIWADVMVTSLKGSCSQSVPGCQRGVRGAEIIKKVTWDGLKLDNCNCKVEYILIALRDTQRYRKYYGGGTGQARTIASRPIRFGYWEDCWDLIGLEVIVRACPPSVVLLVFMWILFGPLPHRFWEYFE